MTNLRGVLLITLLSCSSADDTRHGLGGACALNGDCHTGLICVADDPGGQCTRFCSGDAECSGGNLCNDEGKCYRACNQDSDCPRAASDARYGCIGASPRRFCDVLEEVPDGGAD